MNLILILSILAQSELSAKPLSIGGSFVSLADDPSALYYNPAGLTNLREKELLLSLKSPFNYLFIGYSQRIGKEMVMGIGAYRGDGILIGVERDIPLLSLGMGIGLEKEEEKYHPSVSMGLLLSPLWFKDVPGNISSGLSLFYSNSLVFRWGLRYEYEPVKVLFEIDNPRSFHIGTSYSLTLKEWVPQIDIMAGLVHEESFYPSLGLGFDLQDIQLNIGYGRGGFILSALFQIGERMERVVALYAQFREKMYSTSNALVNQGKELYNQGKYKEALNTFDLALIWDPTNKEAQDWYSQVEKKEETKEKKVETGFERIKRYEKKKRWKRALSECNRLLKKNPKDEKLLKEKRYIIKQINKVVNYHLQLGISRFKRGALEEAEKEFEIVLLYQPTNSKAKSYKNKIHRKRRRKKGDPHKLYLAGIEAYTKGEYELSIKLWKRVLEIQPGYPNAEKNIERAKRKVKLVEKR